MSNGTREKNTNHKLNQTQDVIYNSKGCPVKLHHLGYLHNEVHMILQGNSTNEHELV